MFVPWSAHGVSSKKWRVKGKEIMSGIPSNESGVNGNGGCRITDYAEHTTTKRKEGDESESRIKTWKTKRRRKQKATPKKLGIKPSTLGKCAPQRRFGGGGRRVEVWGPWDQIFFRKPSWYDVQKGEATSRLVSTYLGPLGSSFPVPACEVSFAELIIFLSANHDVAFVSCRPSRRYPPTTPWASEFPVCMSTSFWALRGLPITHQEINPARLNLKKSLPSSRESPSPSLPH